MSTSSPVQPAAGGDADHASRRKFPRNVILLGWVSFFTDLASEMLYPIIPLFLTTTLGASPKILGLVDGVAEGLSSGLRWIGGVLSDRYRTRKPFVVAGYGVSALSKPVMGLAAYGVGWPLLFVGRCADRLGKSVRTGARDALITDSTPVTIRGAAFGFHRAMDTAGAVLGPLAALLILWIWPKFPLAWLFFIALAPGICSALVAAGPVTDIEHEPTSAKPPSIFQKYPAPLVQLVLANAVFSLGNSSDQFLILRGKDLGLTFTAVILAYVFYNTIYALGSYPFGALSDKIGRKPVIIAGWLVYAGVYLGFAAAGSPTPVWVLFPIYGLYQAFTDGITKAMVGDLVGKDQRAGAIGLFYTLQGFGQLAASLLAGFLWKQIWGPLHAPFAIGAAFALLAIPIIATVPVGKKQGT